MRRSRACAVTGVLVPVGSRDGDPVVPVRGDRQRHLGHRTHVLEERHRQRNVSAPVAARRVDGRDEVAGGRFVHREPLDDRAVGLRRVRCSDDLEPQSGHRCVGEPDWRPGLPVGHRHRAYRRQWGTGRPEGDEPAVAVVLGSGVGVGAAVEGITDAPDVVGDAVTGALGCACALAGDEGAACASGAPPSSPVSWSTSTIVPARSTSPRTAASDRRTTGGSRGGCTRVTVELAVTSPACAVRVSGRRASCPVHGRSATTVTTACAVRLGGRCTSRGSTEKPTRRSGSVPPSATRSRCCPRSPAWR